MLAILSTTPAWARPARHVVLGAADQPAADYANFCAAAVKRYSGTIKHCELWNEPNLSAFWGSRPDPVKYAAMIAAAYPAMKAADPAAPSSPEDAPPRARTAKTSPTR